MDSIHGVDICIVLFWYDVPFHFQCWTQFPSAKGKLIGQNAKLLDLMDLSLCVRGIIIINCFLNSWSQFCCMRSINKIINSLYWATWALSYYFLAPWDCSRVESVSWQESLRISHNLKSDQTGQVFLIVSHHYNLAYQLWQFPFDGVLDWDRSNVFATLSDNELLDSTWKMALESYFNLKEVYDWLTLTKGNISLPVIRRCPSQSKTPKSPDFHRTPSSVKASLVLLSSWNWRKKVNIWACFL